jgi:hypothetical protein
MLRCSTHAPQPSSANALLRLRRRLTRRCSARRSVAFHAAKDCHAARRAELAHGPLHAVPGGPRGALGPKGGAAVGARLEEAEEAGVIEMPR